jgi:dienelactone hydrolase
LRIPEQHFAIPDLRPAPAPLAAGLTLPPGNGPFPVVILLHGCGGMNSDMQLWADRLAGWGYASLILDSFSARGVYTVCEPNAQHLVTPFDRAGDTLSAALYLRTVPGIDAGRIGVLGTSHGGATAFAVTQSAFQAAAPGLIKASVDYYGPCRNPAAHGTVPLLVLAGEADDWGDTARTCTEFSGHLRPDQPMVIKTYPGVVHAFEYPVPRQRMSAGHLLAYDAAAAEDSFGRVREFLARYLRPAS